MAIFLLIAGSLLVAILYTMLVDPRSVREQHRDFDKTMVESNRRLCAQGLAWAGIRTKATEWCRTCGGLHLPNEDTGGGVCYAVLAHQSPPRDSVEFHSQKPPTDAERVSLEADAIEMLKGWANWKPGDGSWCGDTASQEMKDKALVALAKLGVPV